MIKKVLGVSITPKVRQRILPTTKKKPAIYWLRRRKRLTETVPCSVIFGTICRHYSAWLNPGATDNTPLYHGRLLFSPLPVLFILLIRLILFLILYPAPVIWTMRL